MWSFKCLRHEESALDLAKIPFISALDRGPFLNPPARTLSTCTLLKGILQPLSKDSRLVFFL